MNKHFKGQFHFAEHGFTLLTSVLILGVVSSTIVFSVLLLGVDAERISYTYQESALAKNYADGCAELALQEIQSNTGYTGTLLETYIGGSCEATVIDTGGSTREIESKGVKDGVTRKVLISISQLSPISILS